MVKLVGVGELKVSMPAEEGQNTVSLELGHICLAVEHLMVADCKVMALVGWVVASCVVLFVRRRLMVEERKRSTQTTQVDSEAVMTEAGQQPLATLREEEAQLLWVEAEPEELLSG